MCKYAGEQQLERVVTEKGMHERSYIVPVLGETCGIPMGVWVSRRCLLCDLKLVLIEVGQGEECSRRRALSKRDERIIRFGSCHISRNGGGGRGQEGHRQRRKRHGIAHCDVDVMVI